MNSLTLHAIVQIITESLPISSSTHTLLLAHLLLRYGIPVDSIDTYTDFMLHIPTVLVTILFLITYSYAWLRLSPYDMWLKSKQLIMPVIIAEIITVLLYAPVKLIFAPLMSPIIGLTITACALASTYLFNKNKRELVTLCDSIAIGGAQGMALLPGISRMGLTTAVGAVMGLSVEQSFIFSCLIELPLFGAAGLLGLYKKLPALLPSISISNVMIMLLSMFVAYLCLWCVWYLIKKDRLWLFSLYILFVSTLCALYCA